MDRGATRKLIATLAAILSGGSTYFGAKQEQEERQRDREREARSDQRSDEYLRMQQQYYADAKSERERSRQEATRTEANQFNTGQIERGGTLAEARGYSRVGGQDAVPIARGSDPRSRPSETIPLVTGDNQIDLDLQRIVQTIRQGGDIQGVSQAAGAIDTERGFRSSVREAGVQRDIESRNRIESGTRGERLETEKQSALLQRSINPPRGPAGPDPAVQAERAATDSAIGHAATGLPAHEITRLLMEEYKDSVPPARLNRIAIEAERDAISQYTEDYQDQSAQREERFRKPLSIFTPRNMQRGGGPASAEY